MTEEKSKQPEQILSLLHAAIDELESPNLRSQVLKGLIKPICERRTFPTEGGENQSDLWIFYIVPRGDVALAYSDAGYDSLVDCRWGLVFVDDDQFGGSGAWYHSLSGLLQDSGYFEIE